MDGDDEETQCEYHDMTEEELMYVKIYADKNDAEGITWWGHKGTEWISRANGEKNSNKEQMGGRPIGFRVWMGTGGRDN